MGVYDQIKKAFQDLIAPELHAIRGDIRLLDQKIAGVDQKIDGVDQRRSQRIDSMEGTLGAKIEAVDGRITSLRGELLAEIRRIDTRIDGLDRQLHPAIDIRERLAAIEARLATS